MRSPAFAALAASAAMAAATIPTAADSAPARGSQGSQMIVGQGPPPRPPMGSNMGGWGVPALPLHPPLATSPGATRPPGGWGPGGWAGGQRPESWRGTHHPGSGHRRAFRGGRLSSFWIAPSFYVSNWPSYGLYDPGHGRNWVRYYDDAVLVDGSGYIYDSRYGIDWRRYESGPVPEYVGDEDGYDYDDEAGYGYYGDDAVTWRHRSYPPVSGAPWVYRAPPGTTTTVVIHSAPVITTTTTYIEEASAPKRVWSAPKKTWKPKARKTWKPKAK